MAPFIYIALKKSDNILPIVLYLLIIAPYYLANFLKYKAKAASFDVTLSLGIMKFLIIGYFCCRINYIYELTLNVINGSYFAYAYELTVNRYSDSIEGSTEGSIAEKISTILFIACASILGANWSKTDKKFIALFCIMIIIELSNTAKAGVLLALSALSVELIISNRININNLKLNGWFKYSISAVIIISFIGIFSALGRLSANDDLYELLIEKLNNYIFGTYEALYIWLNGLSGISIDYGYNTFGGVYKIFGASIPQGHYTPVDTSFGETNVFTVVRDLTQDFTLIGSGIFFFIAGIQFKKMDAISNYPNYILSRYIGYMLIFFFYSPFLFFTVWVGFSLPLVFLIFRKLI